MVLYLGHHVCTTYGFNTAASYGASNGADIIQIFLRNQRSYSSPRKSKETLIKLKKSAKLYGITILVHGNYLLNFCNPVDSDIHKKSIKILSDDLDDSYTLGSLGVVIHMGKNVKDLGISKDEAVENYVSGINSALDTSNEESILILETGAGQGTEVCTDLYDLGRLRKLVKKEHRKRIKFCLDTCHMFAAGYDMSNKKYVRMLEKVIDNYLGWKNVAAVHLNDSKQCCNSHRDNHADFGKGFIGCDGLIEFIKICIKKNIPIVLETPSEKHNDIRYTHSDQMKEIKKML